MLFSEPKIPQLEWQTAPGAALKGFSALQRAENSSILDRRAGVWYTLSVSVLFSEPKIPQSSTGRVGHLTRFGFSALQRAENSSIWMCAAISSRCASFSALQRAENSSIAGFWFADAYIQEFQCSSASRKFLNVLRKHREYDISEVSVLFSEPKIPQSSLSDAQRPRCTRFSALQRAENSSIHAAAADAVPAGGVSVLFSEPKIPQLCEAERLADKTTVFQCSSASRKFLNFGLNVHVDLALKRFSALQRAENSSIT